MEKAVTIHHSPKLMRLTSKTKSAVQLINSPADLWLLARIAGFVLILPILLRTIKLPRLMSWLTPERPGRASDELQNKIKDFTLVLLNQEFWMFRNSCLKKGLTLYHFLPLAGLRPRIRFGVEKPADNILNGHCWLEIGDRLYMEDETVKKVYTVVYSYPEGQ